MNKNCLYLIIPGILKIFLKLVVFSKSEQEPIQNNPPLKKETNLAFDRKLLEKLRPSIKRYKCFEENIARMCPEFDDNDFDYKPSKDELLFNAKQGKIFTQKLQKNPYFSPILQKKNENIYNQRINNRKFFRNKMSLFDQYSISKYSIYSKIKKVKNYFKRIFNFKRIYFKLRRNLRKKYPVFAKKIDNYKNFVSTFCQNYKYEFLCILFILIIYFGYISYKKYEKNKVEKNKDLKIKNIIILLFYYLFNTISFSFLVFFFFCALEKRFGFKFLRILNTRKNFN